MSDRSFIEKSFPVKEVGETSPYCQYRALLLSLRLLEVSRARQPLEKVMR